MILAQMLADSSVDLVDVLVVLGIIALVVFIIGWLTGRRP